MNFLVKCRDADVYPKFTKWKNTRYLDSKQKKKIFRRNLLNEISLKHKSVRKLSHELTDLENKLFKKLTLFKGFSIRYSIRCSVNSFIRPIDKKLSRKFDILVKERDRINGITNNPNTIITNLSSRILTNEEYTLLRFGLNHGLASRPNEIEMFALAEDVWHQLYKSKSLKHDPRSIERAKNSIRAFTFNVLDIDDKRFYKDAKNIKLIKNLKKDVAILKPDKENGVVLIDIHDYRKSLSELFEDRSKFSKLNCDPTFTRLRTLRKYLKTIHKRNEIDEAQYNTMRPKHAKPARAHGLPKTHKPYENLPKFM